MQQLCDDILHQHESFIRVSQIAKLWKMMIVDECGRYVDKIVAFVGLSSEFSAAAS
jgi:hypothetical protein